jgi:hypothetical protein
MQQIDQPVDQRQLARDRNMSRGQPQPPGGRKSLGHQTPRKDPKNPAAPPGAGHQKSAPENPEALRAFIQVSTGAPAGTTTLAAAPLPAQFRDDDITLPEDRDRVKDYFPSYWKVQIRIAPLATGRHEMNLR